MRTRFSALVVLGALLAATSPAAQTPPDDDFRDDFATGAPVVPSPGADPNAQGSAAPPVQTRPATNEGFADFIPAAPLPPLEDFLSAPVDDASGWQDAFFGEAGTLPPLDAEPEPARDSARASEDPLAPDLPGPDTATLALPPGWAWHEVRIFTRDDIAGSSLRLALPAEFTPMDPETTRGFTDNPGSAGFIDVDLMAMAEAVMRGDGVPHGRALVFSLSDHAELGTMESDSAFTLDRRDRLILPGGIALDWISGMFDDDGLVMHFQAFESLEAVAGGGLLVAMMASFSDDPDFRQTAETIMHSLTLAPFGAGSEAEADETSPDDARRLFLDGALVVDGLPAQDWRVLRDSPTSLAFQSTGEYRGFITIETGQRAETDADPGVTFSEPPETRRGTILGQPAILHQGRQSHDGFLQGGRMVTGPRLLALPDACLPNGDRLAITWAGSPLWFDSGAFDRFFAAARLEGLVPCPIPGVPPPQQPEPAPPGLPDAAAPLPAKPAPDVIATPQPAPPEPAPHEPAPAVAAPGPDVDTDADAAMATLRAEILYWESVRDSADPASLQAYLTRWPDGQFAVLARLRLARAASSGTPSDTPATDPQLTRTCLELTLDRAITDPDAAVAACRRAMAAQPGDAALENALARALHAQGNPAQALAHFRRAADQGHAGAMTALALAYRLGDGTAQDDAMAVYWYRQAAAAGDAQAMNNLGFMHSRGLGGLAPDRAEAASWYLRAAEAGSGQAMNNIGQSYRQGLGVPRDLALALYWLRRGAEAGHPSAMNNLGGMLSEGEGTTRDPHQALTWFHRAAEQDHAAAMANIGLAHAHGHGVRADPAQAADWLDRAIRGGVGEQVVGVLDSLPRPTLAELQRRLARAGVYDGAIDGIPGPRTRAAVRDLSGMPR